MQIDLTPFRQTFLDESGEHTAAMEEGLLRLESSPGDIELLNSIFRAAHSIKGGAGSFGFDDVAHFTHRLENLLDKLRNGEMAVTHELVDLLLRGTDTVKALLAAARSGEPAPPDAEQLVPLFDAALGNASAPGTKSVHAAATPTGPARWTVEFAPSRELFQSGMDPLLVIRDLLELGTVISLEADLSAVPSFDDLDPELCFLAWKVVLETSSPEQALRDVFLFVEDGARLSITRATESAPSASDDEAAAATSQAAASAHDAGAASTAQAPTKKKAAAGGEAASIRVSVEKVDQLINLIGELVISQSMVSDVVTNFSSERLVQLREAVIAMERNTRDLQERVMAVRMVPIGSIFGRYPRLVRDLSSTFSKKMQIVMEGEETELDKGVVEKIGDPLTHLIRNSCDHGVEPPAVRLAAGKPEEGTIRLSASTEGGAVYVEVSDDGGGLDTERIRAKAIEKGLMRPDDNWSPDQINQLIFQPAFSTAQKVTDVSGRGVGMDVVKKNVEALGGAVTIFSERGKGARFRIKLPLTLAILDGLTLSVGGQMYILPLVSIVESFRPKPETLKSVLGAGEIAIVRRDSLPLLRLHRLLGIDGAETDPTKGLLVIVESDGTRVALLVDELCGQHQVVIKNLDANFRRVEGVMGATIMGDGRIALILDIPGLMRIGLGARRDAQLAPSFS